MHSDILKNIRQYKWKSMYFKYISSYLGLAVITYVGLILIFISYFMPSMNELFEEKAIHAARTTSAVLDYEISEIYSTMASLITSNDVFNIIECSDLVKPPFTTQQSLQSVARFMSQKKTENSDLTDIVIYNSKCDYAVTSFSSGLLHNLEKKPWTNHLTDLDDQNRFSIFYENEHFYLCQKLNSGMIIIELEDIFNTISIDGSLYIFESKNDNLVYASDSDSVQLLPRTQKQNPEFLSYTRNNTIYIQIDGAHWFTYLYATPSFNIFDDVTFWSVVFLLGFFLLFIIIILSIYQTNSSYRHIANILALCDMDSSFSHDEWMTISNHLINLTNEKVFIEKELMDKINQMKKYQHIALQAQLTPHFLFNTLHMINLSIQDTIHGDCKGTKMITQLSTFLRITLDAENIISLKDELQHAESYLALEQLKYEKHLLVDWQIDYKYLNLQCPKLILQPLLENSITHGMKEDTPLTITVKVLRNPKNIAIVILDNGLGMKEEQLSSLRNHVGTFPENKHIGLINVIKRLQLYYGDEFDYNIESEVNRGTSITLYIPPVSK